MEAVSGNVPVTAPDHQLAVTLALVEFVFNIEIDFTEFKLRQQFLKVAEVVAEGLTGRNQQGNVQSAQRILQGADRGLIQVDPALTETMLPPLLFRDKHHSHDGGFVIATGKGQCRIIVYPQIVAEPDETSH